MPLNGLNKALRGSSGRPAGDGGHAMGAAGSVLTPAEVRKLSPEELSAVVAQAYGGKYMDLADKIQDARIDGALLAST